MTWDLKIWPCYHSVMQGPDMKQRNEDFEKLISRFVEATDKQCLQVGIQPPHKNRFGSNFVTLDLYDERPCIDVREDLAHTSFADKKFDLIVCNAILEHVLDPFGCVKEMHRIAKRGCVIWVEVPFVQPYHPRRGSCIYGI